ncbi:DIP1984 family protein, partial [Kitasatospora purpeofusca]
MKLAEALAQRAAAVRRVEQLRVRVVGSARYQEGEEPAENAAEVLAQAGEVLDELE